MRNFINGVNLGGWLSQYPEGDPEHFATFITEADIQRIASWGMDHVRLPVDYPVIESDDAVGQPIEEGYQHIRNCLQWCADADLSVVLDLHRAPQYAYADVVEDTARENTLFTNRASQRRFVELWATIATQLKDSPAYVAFELLNQVVVPDVGAWNRLIIRTVDVIRQISPLRTVIIGGNTDRGAADLNDLVLIADPNALFTFHFYEPLRFTHQGATWLDEARGWDGPASYPGDFGDLGEHVEPAIAFAQKTGRRLYCAEYGVAGWVDPESRRNWLADVTDTFASAGIGRALWNYKGMDFGLIDADGSVVDQEFLDIVRGQA